jgi:hypothetical protein
MKMRHVMAVVAGLWLSAAVTVDAAGICFQAGNNNLAVVKRYSKPSRGTCKNFAGWEAFLGSFNPIFGTACLNSAGDQLRVGYTIAGFGAPTAVAMTLPYPSLLNGVATSKREPNATVSTDALAGSCIQLFQPLL